MRNYKEDDKLFEYVNTSLIQARAFIILWVDSFAAYAYSLV